MNKPLLQQLDGHRAALEATVTAFRTIDGYKGPVKTLLLTNIRTVDGTVVLDEYWCALTQGHRALRLQRGDRIAFTARVQCVPRRAHRSFRASNVLHGRPVLLSHPTQLRILLQGEAEAARQRALETASQRCQYIANLLSQWLFSLAESPAGL